MLWAHLIIVLSVACGTLLALLPRKKDAWIGPARTFALTAALSVVIVHLLPEAMEGLGAGSLLAFLLGVFLPGLLGRFGAYLYERRHGGERHKEIALETSYAGLLLHRVGDGLGLGAFAGEIHFGGGQGGVITALAAHSVPYVAIVVLTFDSVRGRGSAIGRAIGLALASMIGVVLARLVPLETFAEANSWVAALVGGMLLHVVSHDIESQSPETFGERSIDFVAALLGIVVSFLGDGAHGEEAHGMGREVTSALLDLGVETGPLLVLGLGVGALLTAFGRRLPDSLFRSRGPTRDAIFGALFGAPLPLCSCSVLPISEALLRRGASAGFVVAFLLATPELGFETFWLSFHFLGPRFAIFRIVGAVLVSTLAGIALAKSMLRGAATAERAKGNLFESEAESEGGWTRFVNAFDELFHHVGAWMVVGVVLAALLDAALEPATIAKIGAVPLQFLVVTLVAIPSYVCAPSATPLAAVLVEKGADPGAVLVGLLLGPATNVATFAFLRRSFGTRGTLFGTLAVVLGAWALGALFTVTTPHGGLAEIRIGKEEHGALWIACAFVSLALLLRAIFRSGARRFIGTLGFGHGEHGHSHGELHGHSHGISSERTFSVGGGTSSVLLGAGHGHVHGEQCDHDAPEK